MNPKPTDPPHLSACEPLASGLQPVHSMNGSRENLPYAKACLALALLFTVCAPKGYCAEDWQDVFDPFRVLTLHLEMDPADWDRVRFDQPSQSESWVPEVAEASFWTDGESPLFGKPG
jgi:hypothetical protein